MNRSVDLPTLEDALFAAEGLTPDTGEQIRIAADLMQMPVEQTQVEVERIIKDRAGAASRRPAGSGTALATAGPAGTKS